MSEKDVEIYEGHTNIFADLGLPEAEGHFIKAQIVAELFKLTTEQRLTQNQAGERMGISQPEISRLFKGNFREYSVERLMGFLVAFDHDVDIIARPRAGAGERGHITFTARSV